MDTYLKKRYSTVFNEFEQTFGLPLEEFEENFSLFGGFDFDKHKFIAYLKAQFGYERTRDGNIQTFLKEWFGKNTITLIKIIEGEYENDSVLTY